MEDMKHLTIGYIIAICFCLLILVKILLDKVKNNGERKYLIRYPKIILQFEDAIIVFIYSCIRLLGFVYQNWNGIITFKGIVLMLIVTAKAILSAIVYVLILEMSADVICAINKEMAILYWLLAIVAVIYYWVPLKISNTFHNIFNIYVFGFAVCTLVVVLADITRMTFQKGKIEEVIKCFYFRSKLLVIRTNWLVFILFTVETIAVIACICIILYSGVSVFNKEPYMLLGDSKDMYFKTEFLITLSLFIGQEPNELQLTETGMKISILVKILGYFYSLLFLGTISGVIDKKKYKKTRRNTAYTICDNALIDIKKKYY